MMYVVEVPRTCPAVCWSVENKEEFYHRVDDMLRGFVPYEESSLADVMALWGVQNADEARKYKHDTLASLIEQYDPETTIYCAMQGDYTVEPIDKFKAYQQALSSRLVRLFVFENEREATMARMDDELWPGAECQKARQLLRNALVENEAKAKDNSIHFSFV